jgi:hypothetical protein
VSWLRVGEPTVRRVSTPRRLARFAQSGTRLNLAAARHGDHRTGLLQPRGGRVTTAATTWTGSRPPCTDCWRREVVTLRGPALGGGRVLSADHAPQTPQAPSEDVSAATRPNTVFARPGALARVAVRKRLQPSQPQLLRRAGARLLSAGVSRDRGLPPRWRANGAWALPRNGKGRPWVSSVDARCAGGCRFHANSRTAQRAAASPAGATTPVEARHRVPFDAP